jgi:hypothetical protein
MNHLLVRKKSSLSFCGKQSEASSAVPSSIIPSDQKPRETKNTPYICPSYKTILASKNSFIGKFDLGIIDASKKFYRTLFEAEQSIPQDILFRNNLFDKICKNI